MVCCDDCDMWVHGVCDGLEETFYCVYIVFFSFDLAFYFSVQWISYGYGFDLVLNYLEFL